MLSHLKIHIDVDKNFKRQEFGNGVKPGDLEPNLLWQLKDKLLSDQ